MNTSTDSNPTGEPGAGRACRILVIDDEPVIHISLQRILGRQGHEVDCVLSGAEGLEKLRGGGYDLVISDLMMPEMNGIQILERMQEARLAVPVMMITGYPSIRTAMQALRLGAVDYLAKPFTRQEILGPVNRTLRGAAADGAVVAAPPPAEASAEGLQAPDVHLEPGDCHYLRKHAWAVYQQDGTMNVGIEQSFLDSVHDVTSIDLPETSDVLEQGYTGFRLKTVGDEEHSVFMPLSGTVMSVNEYAVSGPGRINPDTWLIRVLPSNLEAELPLLLKR